MTRKLGRLLVVALVVAAVVAPMSVANAALTVPECDDIVYTGADNQVLVPEDSLALGEYWDPWKAFHYRYDDGAALVDPTDLVTLLNIDLSDWDHGAVVFVDDETTPTEAYAVRIVGTPFDDIICGGEGIDVIRGMGGDDRIFGLDGDDILFGGPGDDYIEGGSGDNGIAGGGGADAIYGASPVDAGPYPFAVTAKTVTGNPNSYNTLLGGGGADVIYGNQSSTDMKTDEIFGGAGADTIFGGPAVNAIWGGGGDDVIKGGKGADVSYGGGGNDTLYEYGGSSPTEASAGFMAGGAGDDTIYGGKGADDEVWGGPGNDIIQGATGDDLLRGGAGNDTIYGGFIAIPPGIGDPPGVSDGDDELFGDEGNDTLYGGFGSDELWGDGDTVLDYSGILFGLEGTDTLYGGSGVDHLMGGKGADQLFGEVGDDVLFGNRPNFYTHSDWTSWGKGDGAVDTMAGGTGNDVFQGSGYPHNTVTNACKDGDKAVEAYGEGTADVAFMIPDLSILLYFESITACVMS